MNAEVIVDQFRRQAASFARLPSHEEATELLLGMAGLGGGDEVLDVACGPGLREPRWAGYPFSSDLERLMRASFPEPGSADRIRAMFEADVGIDRMGLSLKRTEGAITLIYPVAIVAGVKSA